MLENNRKYILVPFDFTENSFKSAIFAFNLASKLNISIVFLHSYLKKIDSELQNAEKASARFKNEIAENKLPNVEFHFILKQGVADAQIIKYARLNKPELIIMSTRAKAKKQEELIGSITNEVMEHCSVPLFAIPEDISTEQLNNFDDIKHIAFATTLSDEKLTQFKEFMQIMHAFSFKITFVHIINEGMNSADILNKIELYENNLKENFKSLDFSFIKIAENNRSVARELNSFIINNSIDALVIKNRSTSYLSRLFFKSSTAQKLIFHAKTPVFILKT